MRARFEQFALRMPIWRTITESVVLASVIFAVGWYFRAYLTITDIAILALLPVLRCATQQGPLVATSVGAATALACNYLFFPPIATFGIQSTTDLVSLVVFTLVAITISYWVSKSAEQTALIQQQVEVVERSEQELKVLHRIARTIAAETNVDNLIPLTLANTAEATSGDTAIVKRNGQKLAIEYLHGQRTYTDGELKEIRAVANGPASGPPSAPEYSNEHWTLLPLPDNHLLVVRHPTSRESSKSSISESYLHALADLVTVALGRTELMRQQSRAAEEREVLLASIMASVSHDLRTPLGSIIGSVTTLLEPDADYSPFEQMRLHKNPSYWFISPLTGKPAVCASSTSR